MKVDVATIPTEIFSKHNTIREECAGALSLWKRILRWSFPVRLNEKLS